MVLTSLSKLGRTEQRFKRSELLARTSYVATGPQNLFKGPNRPFALMGLCAVLSAMLAKNYVAANYDLELWPWLSTLIEYEFISNSGICTLLSASLAALVVRRQLIINLRPNLSYSSLPAQPSIIAKQKGRTWVVTLTNVGLGPAILECIFYKVSGTALSDGFVPHADAWGILKSRFREYDDFALLRYSPGTAIPASKSVILFECSLSKLEPEISDLDIVVWYRGAMGALYAKRVQAFPEYWPKNQKGALPDK